jgi:hypothetical protein
MILKKKYQLGTANVRVTKRAVKYPTSLQLGAFLHSINIPASTRNPTWLLFPTPWFLRCPLCFLLCWTLGGIHLG